MGEATEYVPPKVWTWNKPSGGTFASINRPTSGATHEKELPVGRHPLQLYSLATPNGVKVTVMLEELLALGHRGAEYDAWLIRISEGDQFGSGFVAVNPNSKIPALLDRSGAERRSACSSPARSWSISRRSSARSCPPGRPRAPSASRGSSGRWAARPTSAAASAISTPMRRARSNTPSTGSPWRSSASSTCSTADSPSSQYIAGDAYTIADIAIFPWYGGLAKGWLYGTAAEFLGVQDYQHVQRWADMLLERPAVRRGRMVNRTSGEPSSQLHERHDAGDFDTKNRRQAAARKMSAPPGSRSSAAGEPLDAASLAAATRLAREFLQALCDPDGGAGLHGMHAVDAPVRHADGIGPAAAIACAEFAAAHRGREPPGRRAAAALRRSRAPRCGQVRGRAACPGAGRRLARGAGERRGMPARAGAWGMQRHEDAWRIGWCTLAERVERWSFEEGLLQSLADYPWMKADPTPVARIARCRLLPSLLACTRSGSTHLRTHASAVK